jgi:4-amino-4-deoxy-L-arabinose transferase-like glycosyltransferase
LDVGMQVADERDYHQIATSIVNGNGFAKSNGVPTSMRPPLYPAIVAAVWTITGTRSLVPVRAAHIVFALLTAGLVFGIARRLFDEKTALVACAFVAYYPSLLFSGVLILTETVFIFLMLLLIRMCLAVIDEPSWGAALGAGLCLGLAALTRSILWPFLVVLVPFLWFTSRASYRERAALCALVIAGYAAVVAPWAVRNTRRQHVPTIVDTMGGINLLTGNYEYTPEDRMWDGVNIHGSQAWYAPLFKERPANLLTEGEKDRWARAAAIRFMAAHPLLTAKRSVLKLADLWGLEREWVAGIGQGLYAPPLWFAIVSSVLTVVAYPCLLLLAICGFCCAPLDRRAHWLFALLIGFTCAVHALTFGHSRYHLPLVPILAIYAAAVVVRRSDVLLELRSRRAVVGALALLCAAVWVREIAFRDAGHIAQLFATLGHLL